MFRGTTIVAVKKGNKVALAGDGQVTFGENTVIKKGANKLRRLYNNKVIGGFAGSVADSIALFDKFEGKLEEYHGNLVRAAVELAKEWRMDKFLRRLEALLLVSDGKQLLIISGNGEVIEPDEGVAAIGSGGSYAMSAALALIKHTDLPPRVIAEEAIRVAADICVYTNKHFTIEEIEVL